MEAKNSPVYEEFGQFYVEETRENDPKGVITPLATSTPVLGKISWYDYGLENEPDYSERNSTCASRDYAKGTLLKVSYKDKSVVCRVNDFVENPDVILDLSSYAFSKLAPLKLGILEVKIENIFCSCVQTANYLNPKVPLQDADKFKPNSNPAVGTLALFKFSNGVYHVALIDKIGDKGFHIKQGNKIKCMFSEEWIDWNNPYLTGFYDPKLK